MIVLRFLGNLVLAILVSALTVLILVAGGGLACSYAWENTDLNGAGYGQVVSLDGHAIHYQTWGPEEAPAVVLIHGLGVEGSATWTANADALGSAGLRVIALDLPGQGYSDRNVSAPLSARDQAGLTAQLLAELQVRGATVVGQGWGSAVALQLAREQPQLVGRLVLIAPLLDGRALPLWAPVARIPYAGRYLGRAMAWLVSSGGPFWRLEQRQGFDQAEALNRSFARATVGPTHIAGTCDALVMLARSRPKDDLTAALPQIKAPTLILVGREDTRIPPAERQRLVKSLPAARLFEIPEARFYVHVEQSSEVNRRLIEFCQQGQR